MNGWTSNLEFDKGTFYLLEFGLNPIGKLGWDDKKIIQRDRSLKGGFKNGNQCGRAGRG